MQDKIPAAKHRPRIEEVREATVVVWRDGQVLLRKRSAGERWAGMWDFPRFPLDAVNGELDRALMDAVAAQTGVRSRIAGHLTTFKHGVTRFRITLECYEARYASRRRIDTQRPTLKWLRLDELSTVALSVPARKIAVLIAERGEVLLRKQELSR
jgi:A/G-specific adenine glycosylase